MARQYCKYHPLEPALWYSGQRHVAYCERCVDSGETLGGMGQAKCFVTGEELDYLGSANTAQPFWDRLGAFFRYPFQQDSLLMLGIFMILSGFVVGFGSPSSLVFLIITGILLLACITRYGFMILEHSSEGRFTPPTLQETFSDSGLGVLGQQVVVQLIFIGFLILVSMLNSGFLNVLANALVLFVLPASMMLLATEKSISAAIVPGSVWHMIRSIGWPYLLLYAFLFLLLGAESALFEVFAEEISPRFFIPVFVGVTLYFMMVAYHLMGYVVFQYQAEIGFIAEDQSVREKRRKALDPVDTQSELMVKEGQYRKAADILTRHVRSNPSSVRHHEKLSKLLLAMEDREDALAHGQIYMKTLSEMGDDSRLYFVFSDYEKLDPAYKPSEPEVLLNLAHQFFNRGKFKRVCQFLTNLHKIAPHFEGIPEAYVLTARALLDGFNEQKKAAQYLQFVRAKYPNCKELTEVNQLLKQCAG